MPAPPKQNARTMKDLINSAVVAVFSNRSNPAPSIQLIPIVVARGVYVDVVINIPRDFGMRCKRNTSYSSFPAPKPTLNLATISNFTGCE